MTDNIVYACALSREPRPMPFGSAARVVPVTRLDAVLAAGNAHMRLKGPVARTGAGQQSNELAYPTDEEFKAMADWMQGLTPIMREKATKEILNLFARLNQDYPIRMGQAWIDRMRMLTRKIPNVAEADIERYFLLTNQEYAMTGGMPSTFYDSPYKSKTLKLGEEKMVQVRDWMKANRCQFPWPPQRRAVAKTWGWNAKEQDFFVEYTAAWMNKIKTQENRELGGAREERIDQDLQTVFSNRFETGYIKITRANLYADEKLAPTDAAFRSPALGTIRNKGSLPYLHHLRRHEPQKASSVVDELLKFERMRI